MRDHVTSNKIQGVLLRSTYRTAPVVARCVRNIHNTFTYNIYTVRAQYYQTLFSSSFLTRITLYTFNLNQLSFHLHSNISRTYRCVSSSYACKLCCLTHARHVNSLTIAMRFAGRSLSQNTHIATSACAPPTLQNPPPFEYWYTYALVNPPCSLSGKEASNSAQAVSHSSPWNVNRLN